MSGASNASQCAIRPIDSDSVRGVVADVLIDNPMPEFLQLLRDRMNMDVVFVSEFTGGRAAIKVRMQASESEESEKLYDSDLRE